MHPIRLLAVALLLTVASCGSMPAGTGSSASILIDEPTPPFPYNSRICP
jgi:hypothetical protein